VAFQDIFSIHAVCGELVLSADFNGSVYMGDRSPKAVQKQATQKQSKTEKEKQKKQEAMAARQGNKARPVI